MTGTPSPTVVIGVGNSYCRDDGAGIAVAQRVREAAPAGVTVREESGEGASLMAAWQGAESVVLVDAVSSGAPPGTIHRLDANAAKMPGRLFRGSTHAFSVAEAIELARTLNQLPPNLLVLGIEGQDFSAGVGLSSEVEQAAAAVAAEILGRLRPG